MTKSSNHDKGQLYLNFAGRLIGTIFTILMFVSVSLAQVASGPININGQSNIVIEDKAFTSGSGGASIKLTNCNNVVIRNCTFTNIPNDVGVQLQNCSNVEVTGCDFNTFKSGVYAITSSGINVHCNSFTDIVGPKPRGQIVQYNHCTGTGNRCNYNILEHQFGAGNPEDLINMYGSSGTPTDPLQIIGNLLRGGGPSKSGGGIMVGDNDGHDILVEDNILVDPGQYGIGCPAGENITIRNNKVYGKQQSFTNVGIYVGLASEIAAGHPCVAHTIRVENNEVKWTNKDGNNAGFWNCGCCSGIINTGNNFNASFGPEILPATLSLNQTQCGTTDTTGTDTFDCTSSVPAGYQSILCQNYETTLKAADYLGTDVWYFYDGGSPSSNNNPELDKRFIIKNDPAGGANKALHLIKFDGDDDYSGQGLNPRTELSYRPSMERSASEEIYYRIRTFFPSNQANTFSAEFIQFWLHGSSNIPMQIEVRNGNFGARRPGQFITPFAGKTLNDNLNRWITWEIRAKFNNNGGYWNIYMDGQLVFSHTNTIADWPGNGGTWHPQNGAYANNGGNGTMEVYFDDLLIAEKTGQSNQDPTVTITAPGDGDQFPQGFDINLLATANDPDGSIASVEFKVNGSTVATELLAPYEGILSSPVPGTYTIEAIATDNLGATATDMITINVVDTNQLIITPIDDAYLQGATGFNTTDLRIEDGNRVTYLKFEVTGITTSVASAVLEMTVGSDAGNGLINLHSGDSNNWTENNISTANAPVSTGVIATSNQNYAIGDKLTYDVTNYIMTNGTYSFLAEMVGGNDVSFWSSEGTVTPKLIITLDTFTITNTENKLYPRHISLYPNPASSILNVDVGFELTNVSIRTVIGIEVLNQDVKGIEEIDISGLPSGTYIVLVNNPHLNEKLRLIRN